MTRNDSIAAIEALVQLVSRWQPDFAQKIVGAPAESIARLEARLVEPLSAGSLPPDFEVLPPEHRVFLERMGENYDGINSYNLIDLRCAALLEYMNHEDIDYQVDPRQFVLCGAPSDLLVDPLMFDRRVNVDPLPLVRFGGYDEDNNNQPVITREHSSFVAMLFLFAFIRKSLPRFDWGQDLRSPGTKQPQFPNCPPGRWLPHFAVITRQLGFVPISHTHTGPWTICAEREDAAVMMYECGGYAPDVRVAARDRETLNKVVEVLCDNLELRRHMLREPP